MHRCANIAPSLSCSRRMPCQFGEKCSSPLSETVSLTIAAKRLCHQGHRTWMIRVPSIPFCPSRLLIRVPFEYGVLVARVPERKPTPASHVCTSLLLFVISSSPVPSSRLGPTDRHDGDAQMRKSLRLFPFASPFAVLVFAVVTIFMSSGSRGGKSAWNSRSVSPMSTIRASIPPIAPGIVTWVRTGTRQVKEGTSCGPQHHSHQAAASFCVRHDFFLASTLCRSSSSRCMQVLFRVVAQVPVCLPKLSHLFSADCLFRNQFATECRQSFFCVVSLGCAV